MKLIREHQDDYLYDHIFYPGRIKIFLKKTDYLYLSEEELEEKFRTDYG